MKADTETWVSARTAASSLSERKLSSHLKSILGQIFAASPDLPHGFFSPAEGFLRRSAVFSGSRRVELALPLDARRHENMQPLQVEGETNQAPLPRRRREPAQRELSKTQDFLDDPDHRLHGTLSQAVNRLPDFSL